ncbi:MAG: cytochrome d ubiquinol oxidase subunit II [Candidatus Omnitrophica bacterium]|nr:cytochrome d ubiquinol oxidase subunit II [Candidatus Omnitrophota bacterium]
MLPNIQPDLNLIWFIGVGILFTGYAILDGFDLGVGALHLLTKTDEERRLMINSIGPVWDGNEVWLVTGGGALFAAFPVVYAAVFSGFYTAFYLLLFALIFRAIAIEFRSKQPMKWWRNLWDASFSVSSIFSSFLIGIVLANIAWGVPLNAEQEYAGNFWGLFHPYSILVGLLTISLFMMHGAIYVVMKTEGDLQKKISSWINKTIIFFIICYATTTMATLLYLPHMTHYFKAHPWLFGLAFLNMLAIANIPREITHGHEFRAFLSSCAAVVMLMAIFGLGMFPNLVVSNPHAEYSLTLYNAASSQKTLRIMLYVALLGLPLVLAYTVAVYWIFRGKVKLDKSSY